MNPVSLVKSFTFRVAAHAPATVPTDQDIRLADEFKAAITAKLKAHLNSCPTPDELYGPDGRSLHVWIPRALCGWCRADYYDERDGRCRRCNEPYYDGALFWPGPTTATLTPCVTNSATLGVRYLSVAQRMFKHWGPGSARTLAYEGRD